MDTLNERKNTIIKLLRSTNRDGMGALVDEMLIAGGFFESPASVKYHGSYAGGLARHSLNVYERMLTFDTQAIQNSASQGAITLPVTSANLIIAALLHDVCKVGAYLGGPSYRWNRAQPKGHALLSLVRIAEYIKMEPIEEMMITFHMGTYGTLEFGSYCSEYPIRGDKSKNKEERYGKSLANAWYHNPIVKLMYFCDEMDNMAG